MFYGTFGFCITLIALLPWCCLTMSGDTDDMIEMTGDSGAMSGDTDDVIEMTGDSDRTRRAANGKRRGLTFKERVALIKAHNEYRSMERGGGMLKMVSRISIIL